MALGPLANFGTQGTQTQSDLNGGGMAAPSGNWNGASNWANTANPTVPTAGGAPPINRLGGTGNLGTQPQNPYSWLSNPSITSPDNHGGSIIQSGNPMQWATQGSAQNIANQFGGNTFGMNITSPGGSYSDDQQMIGFGNGNNINAGLAGDVLNKYGNGPTSYGSYLVDRDKNGGNGSQNYGQWATSQPGFKMNPLLANSGPGYNMVSDGKGGYSNAAQPGSGSMDESSAIGQMRNFMDQQQQQQQPQLFNQPGLQPQQGQTIQDGQGFAQNNQQQNQQNQQNPQQMQFMQQFAQLLPLIQMLLGGGGGMGQQQHQRPPMMPQGSAGNSNYYSRFA